MSRLWSGNQGLGRVIFAMTGPAAAVAETTTETILVPDVMIPANFFKPGSVVKALLGGVISNVVTTPGTVVFKVRWGGVAGTILASSAALAQTATATTDRAWWWENYITCTSDQNLLSLGTMQRGNRLVAAATDAVPDLIPSNDASFQFSAPEIVNLAAETALSFTVDFSVNTAGTSITCYHYILEALN